MTVIYRVTAINRAAYTGSTVQNFDYCTGVFQKRKWQGDCYIQGDPYKQVNFAENIGQLKI